MRRQFGGKGGAVKVEAIWRGPDSRPALQPGLIGAVLEEAHGLTHSNDAVPDAFVLSVSTSHQRELHQRISSMFT